MQTSSGGYKEDDTNRGKRNITAARREQNRVGQKAYRQRLKEARKKAVKKRISGARRFRELRPHQALTSLSSGGTLAHTHGQGCQQQLPGPAKIGSGGLDATICLVAANLYPAEASNDPGLTLEQSTLNTPNCSIPVSDTPELDLPIPPSPEPSSSDLSWSPTWADLEVLLPQVYHNMAMLPSQAAVNDISNPQVPLRKCTTLADPVINNIQFTPASAFMAALDNALILRLDLAKLRTADCVSPFYQPMTTPQDDPQSLLASVSHPWIPAHLQPTLAQTLYPHHPFLDLLPFPLMRANAITMWTLMPHVFDLFDFKNDIIFNGALVCWTSNSSSRQPWDMRSWEAAPWFLKKWRVLLDGECGGEIWKHSSWWWNMRDRPYNLATRTF